MSAPGKTPAGWYVDPQMINTQRYWDGVQWSDQIRPMVDGAAIDPSFAPAPGQPPGPVLIRKDTKGGRWGAFAILAAIALVVMTPILLFIGLIVALGSGDPFLDDEANDVIEATVVTESPHEFDQDAQIFFLNPEAPGEDAWTINIGAPINVTASVLDNNPVLPLDALDIGYIAFDVDATLIEAADNGSGWFDLVVVGGATGTQYRDAEPTAPCGQTPEQFSQRLPIGPGTNLTERICVPVQAEDINHPDTRVELITPTGRAIFQN